MPRVVLGMTLYNHATHLREAADSLLSQTNRDFALLMLDDASSDDTEAIAREYERQDSRVHYFRHEARQGMVPTWREVVERAATEYPGAEYFAWASDHDRWHPEWLTTLTRELDSRGEVVLAYPLCTWIDDDGAEIHKRPRRFSTRGAQDLRERWSRFCWESVGAGDMVYGLMRMTALRGAGIFRPVLRPDRLLAAELTLQGEISQVEQTLWTRRQGVVGSIERQGETLLAGPRPWWFRLPPWVQHARVFLREYGRADAQPRISRLQLCRMTLVYQSAYMWRHLKRSELGHGVEAVGESVEAARKGARRTYGESRVRARQASREMSGRFRKQARHARHELPLAAKALTARMRRALRHRVRDALVLTRRLGLRGGSERE